MDFTFYTASKILVKKDALKELRNHILHLGKNFLLIIDPAFYQTPIMEIVISQIKSMGSETAIFSEIKGEPTVELVDEVTDFALKNQCDAVISLGGGSCIDVGKAVAATITNGGSVIDYLEVVGKGKKVSIEPAPFIAIPTTAGTGSEVTKNAVLGSKNKAFKRSMRDEKMVATVAILDPTLTIGCPKKVTAFSGIDAMTHLIESYITFRATPLSDAFAIKGIEFAGKYLQKAYENGKDIEAREGMTIASLLGGMAFANAGLGAAHGIGMAIGISYHLSHGEACGIALPHVVKLNADLVTKKLDRVGEALTGKHFNKDGEGTKESINFLVDLNKALGINPNYKFLNIPKEKIKEIARGSLGTSMTSNPKEMTIDSLIEFLNEIV